LSGTVTRQYDPYKGHCGLRFLKQSSWWIRLERAHNAWCT